MFWAFLLSGAVQNVIRLNAPAFLVSFKLEHLMVILTGGGPWVAAFSKISVGAISDCFIKTVPRTFYLAVVTWCEAILVIVAIVYSGNTAVITYVIISAYAVGALYMWSSFAVVTEMFGPKYLSVNAGILYLAYGLASVCLLALFGSMYDSLTNDVPSGVCYGSGCYRNVFIFCGAALTISAISISSLAVRQILK